MSLKSLLGMGNTPASPVKSSYPYQYKNSQDCVGTEDNSSQSCLPVEINKPYVRDLLHYMSDDDCSELLRAIVDAISKEDNNYKISKSIETSIIEFIISKG
jgi:hypothetical protein